ncbi:unnamed protein product [Symbiodinium microadriaticum]|nr:unnamed protein product [Symbiodinium microadriaticum]CAE7921532.1 unnamed protein product [Symbiodinium sp. KB8]
MLHMERSLKIVAALREPVEARLDELKADKETRIVQILDTKIQQLDLLNEKNFAIMKSYTVHMLNGVEQRNDLVEDLQNIDAEEADPDFDDVFQISDDEDEEAAVAAVDGKDMEMEEAAAPTVAHQEMELEEAPGPVETQAVEPSADEGCVVIDSDIDDHESDEAVVSMTASSHEGVDANKAVVSVTASSHEGVDADMADATNRKANDARLASVPCKHFMWEWREKYQQSESEAEEMPAAHPGPPNLKRKLENELNDADDVDEQQPPPKDPDADTLDCTRVSNGAYKDRQPLIDPTTILPLPPGIAQPMPPRDNGDNFVGLRSKQATKRMRKRAAPAKELGNEGSDPAKELGSEGSATAPATELGSEGSTPAPATELERPVLAQAKAVPKAAGAKKKVIDHDQKKASQLAKARAQAATLDEHEELQVVDSQDHRRLDSAARAWYWTRLHFIDYVVSNIPAALYPIFYTVPECIGPTDRQEFDIKKRGVENDILSVTGLAVAVKYVLQLKPGALLYCAVPCASYSFMSSSRHRRTLDNPLGDISSSWVRGQNTLACRVALLLILALVRRVHIFVEHPSSSLLPNLPWFCDISSLNSPELFNLKFFQIKWCHG